MSKTTVIHHSADYDGIFCREIARKFLPGAELIGWDFKDAPLAIPDGQIYILDLPVDRVFGFDYTVLKRDQPKDVPFKGPKHPAGLVWIDHHKSSINSHPADIPGYRIDGVAACRLAWFYFTARERYAAQTVTADFTWFQGHYPWATKQEFVDRKVSEPLAVRLAGEFDVWDKRDARADVFQFGLRSQELTLTDWDILLQDCPPSEQFVARLLEQGGMLQRYQQRNDAGIMSRGFLVEWEGLKFLALNTARCNSNTFAARDVPATGHDALMGFYFDGRKWTVSLYHSQHRKDIDLSLIAVKHNGGGHRGACGFTTSSFPLV